MENKTSLLKLDRVSVSDSKIVIKIPTVGEVLEDEESYYHIVSTLTATPYQYMVQLDNLGIDFTTKTDFELFLMLFPQYRNTDVSLIFGDLDISDYRVQYNKSNGIYMLSSDTNGIEYEINEHIYLQIVKILREINNFERPKWKPGNDAARQYLIDKERRKQRRNINKPYEPYLEKLVIALVNSPEFKYNYEETMDLSIYKFNQSFKQIQTRVTFNNTMIGVYAGTVDTSKLNDRSCLSWLQLK